MKIDYGRAQRFGNEPCHTCGTGKRWCVVTDLSVVVWCDNPRCPKYGKHQEEERTRVGNGNPTAPLSNMFEKTMMVGTKEKGCTYDVKDVVMKGDKACIVTGHDRDNFLEWVQYLQRTKMPVTITTRRTVLYNYFVETLARAENGNVEVLCRKIAG